MNDVADTKRSGEGVFSSTYSEARHKFLAAAGTAGARVASYRHPSEHGPDGEELFLDVAMVGPAGADSIVVVGSGTHGIEGFAGSAAQTAWMLGDGPRRLPKNTAALLTHAHNPWGFAHKVRVTEENVDLNRNFIDYSRPLPDNRAYAHIHPLITPYTWSEEGIADRIARLQEWKTEVGEQTFSDVYNGGQYSHDDGLFFGGRREQWANGAFRRAIRAHAGHAKRAALIDLHTGIGPYLEHVYLCFHKPGTPAYDRARAWWGERAVNRQGVTHRAVANYRGLLVDAFVDMLPEASATALMVEFGTRSREAMQRANLAVRWLRYGNRDDPEQVKTLHADYIESCYPGDAQWRKALIEQSRDIIDRALSGIGKS